MAVHYPELVLHDQSPIHFVSHEHTADPGGVRAIFWEHPKDLRAAVDDVVVMLEHLRQTRGVPTRGHQPTYGTM